MDVDRERHARIVFEHGHDGRRQDAGSAASAAGSAAQPQLASVSCASKPGERTQCPAVTAAGVALLKSTGSAACLLGKTWGYDDKGVWVMDGCSGEFALGQLAGAPAPAPTKPSEPIETWGEFTPGDGFLVGRSDVGELEISAYALVRYMNQVIDVNHSPVSSTFGYYTGGQHGTTLSMAFSVFF